MMTPASPLQPGDAAPAFQLPAINREGLVSLDDYRGKAPVMVALFKGLHCPFCRRSIARLAMAQERLTAEGVSVLAVVNTQVERARQYFRYRPMRMDLASDPEVLTHRAFGITQLQILPDTASPDEVQWPKTATMSQVMAQKINPTGELPQKMNVMEASQLLNQKDGFEMMPDDERMFSAHGTQFNSQFLIDASGVIRWSFVEAQNGLHELCNFPGEDEMLAAARAVRQ
jgi:peroxiredoxin